MKKKFLIFFLICILLTPIFSGVTENGAPLLSVGGMAINVSNCYQTTEIWNELDLSAYTSNKRGKVFLIVEVVSINDDGTEYVYCDFRTKDESLWEPITVMTRYCSDNGDPENTRENKGLVEVWTDTDGFIEWRHRYNQPSSSPNKTVNLQITIMLNIN